MCAGLLRSQDDSIIQWYCRMVGGRQFRASHRLISQSLVVWMFTESAVNCTTTTVGGSSSSSSSSTPSVRPSAVGRVCNIDRSISGDLIFNSILGGLLLLGMDGNRSMLILGLSLCPIFFLLPLGSIQCLPTTDRACDVCIQYKETSYSTLL